ncbi:MAG: prepilin-type N-terminal cleavage/methylation domain-containing protein [bacterium]
MRNTRTGFTLIEILIATMILSTGIMVLLTGVGNCAKMMTLSKQFQETQYIFSLVDLKYPIEATKDVENDIPVEAISAVELLENPSQQMQEVLERYTFERTVDERELAANQVDDRLFIVRSIVSWGPGEDEREELLRYVRQTKTAAKK